MARPSSGAYPTQSFDSVPPDAPMLIWIKNFGKGLSGRSASPQACASSYLTVLTDTVSPSC
jgi:hypothetical protein